MNTLTTFLIFLIVFFLYLHVMEHFKRSEDMEIYEMDFIDNKQAQQTFDIKQPVTFEFKNVSEDFFHGSISKEKEDLEVKIKNKSDLDSGDYVLLPYRSAIKLMETDSKSQYYSEHNEEFVIETAERECRKMDEHFKPNFTLQTKYDMMFGSRGAYTPIRYHTNYRQLMCVKSGKIHVKMTPWKSRKYLYPENDYEHYEFRSPVDVWNPQEKYLHDMDKLKFLEFDIHAGSVLYIPPYWFYSIKYSNESDNCVYCFTYNSIMNCVANSPKICMYFLQQHNIQKKVMKSLENVTITENVNQPVDESTQ